MKDRANALENAESLYIIARAGEANADLSRNIYQLLLFIASEKEGEGIKVLSRETIQRTYGLQDAGEAYDDIVRSLDASILNIGRLLETSSSNQSFVSTLEGIRGRLAAVKKDSFKASYRAARRGIPVGRLAFLPPNDGLTDDDAYQQLGRSYELLRDLRSDLAKFEDTVLEDARINLLAATRRARLAGWASYGLYTLGWGLALAGRLTGGGEMMGAE